MRLDAPCTTRKEAVTLLGTEVPVGGVTVPVIATATGRIRWWLHRPGETLGDVPIVLDPGNNLCVIDVKVDGFPRDEYVKAPIKGKLVKIIKEVWESVEKGETIGEMEPYEHEPSPQPFPWDTIST